MAEKIKMKLDRASIQFVQRIDHGYKCGICQLVLESPVQAKCGHRFCETCITPVVKFGSTKCPEDNTVLTVNDIHRDVCCSREIMKLQCFCLGKELGCDWTGDLQHLEGHLSSCSKFLLPCSKACQKTVARSAMEKHLKEECPYSDTICPMAEQCSFQGLRVELKNHLAETIVEHTSMIKDKLSSMQSNSEKVNSVSISMQEQHQVLENQVLENDQEMISFHDVLANLYADLHRYEERLTNAKERAQADLANKLAADKCIANDMEQLKERLKKLEQQLDDMKQKQIQDMILQHLAPTQAPPNEAFVNMERRLATLEHQNMLRNAQLENHDIKISQLETMTYDGEQMWRIDEFSQHRNEAIFSPPFYVGRSGYKVCAGAYLNGDGMGDNIELSLFLVILNGDNPLLLWPFQQEITFKIIDQSPSHLHIIKSFQTSLQQPTTNTISTESLLFVPRAVLYTLGYIRDDTIFIKINVDTTGIGNI